jgi:hypothetical protein
MKNFLQSTTLIFAISTLLLTTLPARTGHAQESRVDMTTVDVLTRAEFRGDAADLLGLHLGMTWDEAKAACAAHPRLVFEVDGSNPGRAYVMDASNEDGGDPALFYVQWPDGRTGMGRMVIYARAAQFVPEGTRKLLVAPSLAEMEEPVRQWLGTADRSAVTLDIVSIGLKMTSHVFERRCLEVTDKVSSGVNERVIVALVHPDLLAK